MAQSVGAQANGTLVKAKRRRVLQHDLDMYAAISGRRPAMLPEPTPPKTTALARASTASWSPLILCAYLRQMYHRRVAIHVRPTNLTGFFRQISAQAGERLQQAQSRVAAADQRQRRGTARDTGT